MNKKCMFLVCFVCFVNGLYAQAPELRTVMPSSWQKVTRLTPEQEAAFFRENQNIQNSIIVQWRSVDGPFTINSNNISKITRVYREQVGVDIFYRLITANSETPDFTKQEEIRFLQTLIYEYRGRRMVLAYGMYNFVLTGEPYACMMYNSLDIIRSGVGTHGGAKGILFTHMMYAFDRGDNGRLVYPRQVKGQIAGGNNSNYILMKDIIGVLEKSSGGSARAATDGYYNFGDAPCIQIEASPCLVDPNNPLRYSLQNAFDGDPSTSYVENTEDDLMEIRFGLSSDNAITRIAFINGYAENINLYKNNNRIKKIGTKKPQWNKDNTYQVLSLISEDHLLDNCLTAQMFDVESIVVISVLDYYKGDKYNDTCMAELNVKVGNAWLFGEIDE